VLREVLCRRGRFLVVRIRRLEGSEDIIASGCQTWHVGDSVQGGLSGRESW